jgi:hypothetical protein
VLTPIPGAHIASTPLMSLRKGSKNDLLNLHNTISPIYDMVEEKSYTVTKVPGVISPAMERTYDMHNTTVINSATMVKKGSAKRDILAGKTSPEKRSLGVTQIRSPPSRLSPTNTGTYAQRSDKLLRKILNLWYKVLSFNFKFGS